MSDSVEIKDVDEEVEEIEEVVKPSLVEIKDVEKALKNRFKKINDQLSTFDIELYEGAMTRVYFRPTTYAENQEIFKGTENETDRMLKEVLIRSKNADGKHIMSPATISLVRRYMHKDLVHYWWFMLQKPFDTPAEDWARYAVQMIEAQGGKYVVPE